MNPLHHLFYVSLHSGKLPAQWKLSWMTPVHKKGDKSSTNNYRGITSLCTTTKFLEMLVYDILIAYCRFIVSSRQHGFVSKRSVNTNLLKFCTVCHEEFAAGCQVDTIYTDLKAAFDRVDHTTLLAKLERLGFYLYY